MKVRYIRKLIIQSFNKINHILNPTFHSQEDTILYPRLTDISQLISATDTKNDTTKAEEAPTHTESPQEKQDKGKKRKKDKDQSTKEDQDKSKNEDDKATKTESKDRSKKPRWTDEQREVAKKEKEGNKANKGPNSLPKAAPPPLTPTEADALLAEKKKAKQIKKKVRKLNPEERISGPGNIEEAMKIRETLGYLNRVQERDKGANTIVKPGGAFSFGFQPKNEAAAVGGNKKEEKRAPVQNKNPQTKSDTTSNSDSESSDENDDNTSSSSDSDSSGDDTGSRSSSDEEEEEATVKRTTTTTTNNNTNNNNNNNDNDEGLYVPKRVYVGGMPYTCTEDQIQEYWSYCGEIESMDALTFPDTGRFRGLVYITFTTEEGYAAALACDGEECEGKKLKVQKCKKPTNAKNRRTADAGVVPASTNHGDQGVKGAAAGEGGQNTSHQAYQSPARKVAGYNVAYVGNVAYEVDDNALKALFAPYGVTLVRLHTDKDTGKPKGYAHVHFKDEASLDAAVGLDGVELMGRRLRVGYAQAKKE
jgi:nucleolin